MAEDFLVEVQVAGGENKFDQWLTESIRKFEAKTSIEVVPLSVERVSKYRKERALLALLCGWGLYALLNFKPIFWSELPIPFIISLALSGLIYGLTHWGFCLRLFLPDVLFRQKIESFARHRFFEQELFKTQARNGILIVVAHAEHSVYVFADRGFEGLVPESYWAELGELLAKDFASKSTESRFIEALKDFELRLAPKFPASPNNPNELPDSIPNS